MQSKKIQHSAHIRQIHQTAQERRRVSSLKDSKHPLRGDVPGAALPTPHRAVDVSHPHFARVAPGKVESPFPRVEPSFARFGAEGVRTHVLHYIGGSLLVRAAPCVLLVVISWV